MNKLEQEAAKIADVEVDMMQQTGYITIREVEEYKKRLKEKIINIAKTNNTDALEAFEKAANGQATKIIVPSDIAGMAGLAKGIVESVKEDQ